MDNTNNEVTYKSTYVLQQEAGQGNGPVKPKRRHTGLFIGLSVFAVLAVAAVLTFVFAKDVIINKFMLMTKSDKEYFQWVAGREIDAVCDYMSTASVKKGAVSSSGFLPESGQGTVKSTVKTHISDEFADMLNIYPIKDAQLSSVVSLGGKSIGISFTPAYGGNTLFTLNALIDAEAGKVEAELPDYRAGIIDMSSLLDQDAGEGKKLGETIREAFEKASEAAKTNSFDAEEFNKRYRSYTKAMIDEIDDVELKTDSYVSVGEDSVKCTEIRISVSGKELKAQLRSLLKLCEEDYSEDLKKLAGETGNSFNLDDIKKAIENGISDDMSGKLTLYVDNKADLIAIDAKGTYSATTVGAKLRWEKTLKGIKGKLGLSLNQINAVNISFETTSDKQDTGLNVNITPDSFVDTFLGSYQGFSVDYELKTSENTSLSVIRLNRNGSEAASVTMETGIEAFTGHVLNDASKSIYPIEDITQSEYFSISDIISFALGLLDKINEPELENLINEKMSALLGEGFTLDTIRQMRDNGTLDLFNGLIGGNIGPAIDENAGTDEYGNPIPGGDSEVTGPDGTEIGEDGRDPGDNPYGLNAEGYPAYRIETVEEYPDPEAVYYYSHSYLAGYTRPGQYRGRVFTMPKPAEVTPESFENEKKKYLKDLENTILVDQERAVVEMGDDVYIDILPYLYGIAIEAYRFDNSYAKIGENMYGEGLDEQLLGMKVGEVRNITTTLGSQYGDFAGIEATFEVTLREIERYVTPEWTEEFICGYLGYESLDACSDMLMENLVEEADVSDMEIMYALMEEAVSETEVSDIPDEEYYKLWNWYYNRVYDMLEEYGATPEESFAEEGIDAATLYAMLDEDIRSNLKYYCFYAAVAEQEDMKLTGAELIEILDGYYSVLPEGSTTDDLMDAVNLQAIIDAEIEQRIDDLILDSAVIEPYE